jgi:hypothetical protein
MGIVMHIFQWIKYLFWIVFPLAILIGLKGCYEQDYNLGDIESEIDACQWAIVLYATDELNISPPKESMEAVIGLLEDHSDKRAQETGFFLANLELADKEVEEAMTAYNSDQALLARSHIESAIWLLKRGLKGAERLEFDPNLGSIDSPDSLMSRGIREEEEREKKIWLSPGDYPWDPYYMDSYPPPGGYLVEGDIHIGTYLDITIWRLQLAKDQLM